MSTCECWSLLAGLPSRESLFTRKSRLFLTTPDSVQPRGHHWVLLSLTYNWIEWSSLWRRGKKRDEINFKAKFFMCWRSFTPQTDLILFLRLQRARDAVCLARWCCCMSLDGIFSEILRNYDESIFMTTHPLPQTISCSWHFALLRSDCRAYTRLKNLFSTFPFVVASLRRLCEFV